MPSHLPYSFQKKAIQLVLLRVWWKNSPGYWVKTQHASQGDIIKTVYLWVLLSHQWHRSVTHSKPSMDTLDSTLDEHLDQHLINTPLTSWSTDGRHSANYQLSVNRASTRRDVGQVSIKMLMAGWSKISINTQPQMPFVHLIRLFEVER